MGFSGSGPVANHNSVNRGSFSKWRRTRVQISALGAFANSRNIDFCGNFVTLFRDALPSLLQIAH